MDVSRPSSFGAGKSGGHQKLLHALVAGYTSSAEPDDSEIYVLETADATGSAPYIGPSSPAETPPCAHSYVQLLFVQPDGWAAPTRDYGRFEDRIGVDVSRWIDTFGLGQPVAANYFSVTRV